MNGQIQRAPGDEEEEEEEEEADAIDPQLAKAARLLDSALKYASSRGNVRDFPDKLTTAGQLYRQTYEPARTAWQGLVNATRQLIDDQDRLGPLPAPDDVIAQKMKDAQLHQETDEAIAKVKKAEASAVKYKGKWIAGKYTKGKYNTASQDAITRMTASSESTRVTERMQRDYMGSLDAATRELPAAQTYFRCKQAIARIMSDANVDRDNLDIIDMRFSEICHMRKDPRI